MARQSGFNAELIESVYVGYRNAFGIENELLNFGIDAGFEGFNGASEFRYMGVEDLAEVVSLMGEYKVDEPEYH